MCRISGMGGFITLGGWLAKLGGLVVGKFSVYGHRSENGVFLNCMRPPLRFADGGKATDDVPVLTDLLFAVRPKRADSRSESTRELTSCRVSLVST